MFIKLKKLKFKAFRSFKDEQEINLPENGLLGIIGVNKNTKGSSGSGKSNFHLPISYSFGYCPYPSTNLQSWLTDKSLSTELSFELPSGEVTIVRGDNPSITINDQTYNGAKSIDSKLKELIPMSPNMMEVLSFRKQKSHGTFLSFTNTEKQEFLSTVIPLKVIEVQTEASNKRINELEKQILQTEATLKALGDVMPIFPPAPPKDTSKLKEELAVTKKLANSKKGDLDSKDLVLKEYKILFRKIESLSEEELKKDDLKIQELDAEFISINNELALINNKKANKLQESAQRLTEISKLSRLEIILPKLNAELKALTNEVKGMEENQCATCKQDWIVEKALLEQKKAHLKEKQNEYSSLEANLVNLDKLRDEEKELSFQAKTLEKQENEVKTKQALLTQEKASYVKNIKQQRTSKAEKDLKPFLDEFLKIKADWTEINEKVNSLIREIDHTDELNATNEIYYKKQVEAQNSANSRIETTKASLERLKMLNSEELDFLGLMKSFLSGIFDEILQEIAYETNAMLERLPNTAYTTMAFITEVANQKGILRPEIKPVIYRDGKEIPLKAGVSGGQETSIELAVDLAIGKVVGRRTGVMPGWLILDESFDGHDLPCKEACLELLRQAAQDRLIIIIDHASEVKEYFDHCIVIESNNDVSNIREIL